MDVISERKRETFGAWFLYLDCEFYVLRSCFQLLNAKMGDQDEFQVVVKQQGKLQFPKLDGFQLSFFLLKANSSLRHMHNWFERLQKKVILEKKKLIPNVD